MKAEARSLNHYLGLSYFVHPLPLFAVFVLILNDHFLKSRYPSGLTGKLSDVAGVFFFPLFLCALICLARNIFSSRYEHIYWISRQLLLAMIAVTILIFVSVKMIPVVTGFYLEVMGAFGFPSQVVRDPSDLWALLACPFTYWFGSRFTNSVA